MQPFVAAVGVAIQPGGLAPVVAEPVVSTAADAIALLDELAPLVR